MNEVKKQALIEIQKANEMVINEREKFEILFKETQTMDKQADNLLEVRIYIYYIIKLFCFIYFYIYLILRIVGTVDVKLMKLVAVVLRLNIVVNFVSIKIGNGFIIK